MSIGLQLTPDITGDEELVLASALRLRMNELSALRAAAERGVARGEDFFLPSAARHEASLAVMDGLLAKLPSWYRAVVQL